MLIEIAVASVADLIGVWRMTWGRFALGYST